MIMYWGLRELVMRPSYACAATTLALSNSRDDLTMLMRKIKSRFSKRKNKFMSIIAL